MQYVLPVDIYLWRVPESFYLPVCLFGIFVTLENVSLMIFKSSQFWPYPCQLCSVRHLLCHGASVYNGHSRGPHDTQTYFERLAVAQRQLVIRCGLSRLGFEHLIFRMRMLLPTVPRRGSAGNTLSKNS